MLKGKITLKTLLIFTFLAVTFSFLVKLLGFYDILPWNIAYNDVLPWMNKAFEPGTPYVDKLIEYPVIIGLTMHAASLFTPIFYLVFHYIVFLFASLVTTYYLYQLSSKLNVERKNLLFFFVLAPSFVWFSYFNWDILTVMFSVLALYFYHEKRDTIATIFLALGFGTKMYPILFLFPVLLHRPFKEWIKQGLVFAGTFLLVNLYFMLTKFSAWYFIYGFHSTREPNIDSIWALLVQVIPISTKAVNVITLLLFAVAYFYVNLKLKHKGFLYTSYLSLLLFLFVNKVFSPQFLLWLLPFFVLYKPNLKWFYTMEVSNLLVLFVTTTHIFSRVAWTPFLVWSGVFVVIRHVALLLILMKEIRFKN